MYFVFKFRDPQNFSFGVSNYIMQAMKIYTKTGDDGMTSLFGGKRTEKTNPRVEAVGTVDELNSLIGVVLTDEVFMSLRGVQRRSNLSYKRDRHAPLAMTDVRNKLLRIQNELFVIGSNLATPTGAKVKIPKISKSHITRLEKEIDSWHKDLPPLKNFILPGGGLTGAHLHHARSIARRLERITVALGKDEQVDKNILMYINRLSDWFFTAARYINKEEKIEEIPWKGRK